MERRFGCQWPDTSAQLLEHLTRDSRGLGSNPSLVHCILFLPVTTEKMQWTGQCLLEEFSLVLKQFVGRGGGDSKSTGGFKLPQDIATQIYRYMFTHIPNDAHIVTLFQTFIYVTLNQYPPPPPMYRPVTIVVYLLGINDRLDNVDFSHRVTLWSNCYEFITNSFQYHILSNQWYIVYRVNQTSGQLEWSVRD